MSGAPRYAAKNKEKIMVKVENITKIFRTGIVETNVLKGVSFSVGEGEFVAIMAGSGTGKSTLLNILGCLLKSTSGSYMLDGIDVETLDDDRLSEIRNKKVGFVFQSFNLLEGVSATENVLLPLVYAPHYPADAAERAYRALESVGLKDRVNYKPSELSGGQQQRVAIARALINDPAMILADEPTGNLDSDSSKEIMNLIRSLHGKGRTVILVTHDVTVARHADRIVFLKDGRVDREEKVTK